MSEFERHTPSDEDDRYLWDKSGPVDPDVQQLERTLEVLRYEKQAPPTSIAARRWKTPSLAVAALIAITVGVAWMILQSSGVPLKGEKSPNAAWNVVALKGTATIDSVPMVGEGRLAIGGWLETDNSSEVRLEVADIGDVTVHTNSRLQLITSQVAKEHRLHLAHGAIEAFIWAPPKLFFVNTASATAVDLGCHYLLEVDEHGTGRLEVLSGWVAFERDARESTVPQGGVCQTRADIGPGTPYFNDVSEEFADALSKFDFEDGGDEAIQRIVQNARPRDTLTLWHLLSRVDRSQRELVFDQMASFAPLPDGLTREGVLDLDDQMLDDWWYALKATW